VFSPRDAHEKAARRRLICGGNCFAQRVAQKPIEPALAPAASVLFQPAPLRASVLPLCDQVAFHS
jgi:hypothetical protein